MRNLLEDLVKLLKLLKLRPQTGYGQTIIEWREGEIYQITKLEKYRPKDIN